MSWVAPVLALLIMAVGGVAGIVVGICMFEVAMRISGRFSRWLDRYFP